jgi:ribose 5-phosphate isomerase B
VEIAGVVMLITPAIFLFANHSSKIKATLIERAPVMIAIGSDHGGVELKDYLVGFLCSRGVEVRDFGTQGRESVDYPDFGREVSLRVARGEAERGILICTTGIGMSIAANKFPGVRAALVVDLDSARTSREHNDANILVLSGAKTKKPVAQEIVETWLETSFAGGRHQRRVEKITQIEQDLGIRINNVQTEK